MDELDEGLFEAIEGLHEVWTFALREIGGGFGAVRQAVDVGEGEGDEVDERGEVAGRDVGKAAEVSRGGDEGNFVASPG